MNTSFDGRRITASETFFAAFDIIFGDRADNYIALIIGHELTHVYDTIRNGGYIGPDTVEQFQTEINGRKFELANDRALGAPLTPALRLDLRTQIQGFEGRIAVERALENMRR